MAGNNSVVGLETITFTDNMSFDGTERGGAMTTNGQLWIGSTPARHVRLGNLSSSDNSITITNGPGTIDLKSNPAVVPDLHTAKWIVNNVANSGGNQTTIAAAIAASSAGDTIFIMPGSTGVYTENLTLPANINLVAFTGDGDTPHVTIKGKVTMTAAGQSTISNIRLETNGDFCIAVTGTANSVLELNNCYINATNNTAISYTSSGATSGLSFINSSIVVTSGAAFASSGAGSIGFNRCFLSQTTSTANTFSAGFLTFTHCFSSLVNITTSGTSNFQSFYSHHVPGNTTGPALTHGGTGTESYVLFSDFQNNNAAGPVISISAGATLKCGQITATNFNGGVASISGAGTISYSEIGSLIATNTVTVTTQTRNPTDMGLIRAGTDSTFGVSNSGNSNYVQVLNPSNTANSTAIVLAQVGGTSSGDAFYQASVTGGNFWSFGVDNSDSDAFVLSPNGGLGTSNTIRASTAGEINYPLQPSFLAVSGTQSNVTGDGTLYTVTFATEIFDQNADFDGTSTLTAPVTGRYQLNTSVTLTGIGAANTNTNALEIITSNRSYVLNVGNITAIKDATNNVLALTGSNLCDLDAADTAIIKVIASSGTKTIGIQATNSYFSGFLQA